MASPFPRPRPGFHPSNPNPNFPPNPNPNSLPDAMSNLQIGRPRGPPGPSRPPPQAPIAASNGPPPPFPAPAAGPGFPPGIRAPPVGPPQGALRAPFPGSPPPPPAIATAAVGVPPPVGPPASFSVATGLQRNAGTPPAPFSAAPPAPFSVASGPQSVPPPYAGPPSAPFSAALGPQSGPPQPYGRPLGPFPAAAGPQLGQQPYAGPPAPFSVQPAGPPMPPSGNPMWQAQAQPGASPMPGSMQAPPRMFGMPPGQMGQLPPVPQVMGHSSLGGTQVSTPSKIDPNQIPRPIPSSSVTLFETRQGNQVGNPPPAGSEYIVRDTGNCSPRLMRCTMNQIPCTADLLSTSSMPLALMVQPLALPHPEEEPVQVVDFGESGPLRCSRCKGYINPFMRFVDHGRRFICNLCGFTDETPRDYFCNLGPDGRRRDADERPELCRGTVEFVATKEFMVREPMPAVFFFLIDVSMNAIQTGATAAACNSVSQAITDLPEGPRTMVGIATFDSTIHFYNLKRAFQQPLMLIVPDVQDVYTPLHTDLIVELAECRQHLEQLLESIPTMFESNKVAESAFGAAIKAAFLAMKPTGGKLLVFQSVLPSVGIGSLSSREAEGRTSITSGEKEAHKLLQPADKTLKTMAIEFAEYQVCVDIFITSQTYVDMASISVIPRTTGGQVYYYYPFSAISDSAKLYNDLRWNISRPQGFEAVMRVRCSTGVQVQEYSGNFCKRIPTDIDLPGIDCDKTIMVTLKHDDKFQEGTECAFQCALLYTTVYGQRRIRVTNLSLPCTSMLSNLFRSADLDTQFACFLKQAASGIPASPLSQVREQITNLCINILHSYRKFCATVSSSGQLTLPEALKLFPLYTLALVKSIGLRNDGRLDDRSYWASYAASLSITLAVPLVYPRMLSIHDLTSKQDDDSIISSTIPLSSEHIMDDGIYLLENGEDCLIYVGNMVNPDILQQIFGTPSVEGIPSQLVLEQFDNDLSKKLNNVVNEIRRQRCSYLRLRLCKKGDQSGMLFLSYMVEDKNPGGLSYVEFLVHIHRQIQTKMA
ncbi:protein transport protein Sec24-like [Iris pallida]|uniref:Protein transport protein Sec24-like n=1 Tax=Iris pallida TaxID=29817 RepID=A0AAX6EBQ7_IRIPA|nr:protein transport protein Sec24-like [Iris pallida]